MQTERYLDNAATTKVSPVAAQAMVTAACETYGNPSSAHDLGFRAEKALCRARECVRTALGVPSERSGDIIFTSGGTEANHLALFGAAAAHKRRGNKVLISNAEHPSVYRTASALSSMGFTVVEIPTAGGQLDLDVAQREMDETVILVSCMLVNNETGAIFDLAALDRLRKQRCPDALLHTDAVQGFLKLPAALCDMQIDFDLISVSGHKIHAPKGVGALYVRRGVRILPQVFGGGQEKGMRSGTENMPGIVAFGAAAVEGAARMKQDYESVSALAEHLRLTIKNVCPEVRFTCPSKASPYINSLIVPNIRSEIMLRYLSDFGVYVSAGSACSSKSQDNRVLAAYGLAGRDADSTLRVSFCRENTMQDVEQLAIALQSGIQSLVPVNYFHRETRRDTSGIERDHHG